MLLRIMATMYHTNIIIMTMLDSAYLNGWIRCGATSGTAGGS